MLVSGEKETKASEEEIDCADDDSINEELDQVEKDKKEDSQADAATDAATYASQAVAGIRNLKSSRLGGLARACSQLKERMAKVETVLEEREDKMNQVDKWAEKTEGMLKFVYRVCKRLDDPDIRLKKLGLKGWEREGEATYVRRTPYGG